MGQTLLIVHTHCQTRVSCQCDRWQDLRNINCVCDRFTDITFVLCASMHAGKCTGGLYRTYSAFFLLACVAIPSFRVSDRFLLLEVIWRLLQTLARIQRSVPSDSEDGSKGDTASACETLLASSFAPILQLFQRVLTSLSQRF